MCEAVPQPHWPRDWEFANIRSGVVVRDSCAGIMLEVSCRQVWHCLHEVAVRLVEIWTNKLVLLGEYPH